MYKFIVACFFGLVPVALATRAEEPPSLTLPKEVKGAQEKLADWVNGLKGKTDVQIIKQLGKPADKSTWEFDGKKELLLHYKTTSPKITLDLYFSGNRVITVSLHFLSD